MMNNVMIDLESFGQEPGSAILTLSAVQFDIKTGELGKIYHKKIDLNSSVKWGLTIDPSTVMWWMEQDIEARKGIIQSQQAAEDLKEVLVDFYKWVGHLPHERDRVIIDRNDINVWGRGPRFDMGLLAYAYKRIGYSRTPWDFRKERCVRTYEAIAPHIKKECDSNREGILHNGVDDAKHQIKYIVKIHKFVNTPKYYFNDND